MKFCFRLIAALSLSAVLAGQAYAQKQPTPEERAYKFRTSLFQTFSWKLGNLYGAQAKDDSAAFTQHAKDLAYLSTMLEEGFQIENSVPEGSAAKPAIWQDYDSFKEKAATLTEAANELTEEGAMANFNIKEFGSKNCGGCHRDFRVKKDS